MRLRIAIVIVTAWCCLGASCGQTALSILPGVVNSPGNRTLRREIFAFAIDEMCEQMQARSVPLKLRDPDPSIGRFFPNGCNVQQMPSENLFVTFTGHGYAWTNVTGRMGFDATAAVEYDHDFMMDGSTMYVYFRQVKTQSSNMSVKMIERQPGGPVGAMAGMLGQNMQSIATQIGDRVLQHQLARGFTVVRESDGSVSFTLGVLEKGQAPFAPFGRGESDWKLLANDRTELHLEQRDFAGPFTVEDEDDALWLTMLVEGAAAIDVQIYPKQLIEGWITQYETTPQTTPPPAPPLFDEAVVAPPVPVGGKPPLWRRPLRLPVGSYYVMFDNTTNAGRTPPSQQTFDDRAALISYAVQLGDPP